MLKSDLINIIQKIDKIKNFKVNLSFRKISIFPKLIKIKSILPRITHIF